MHWAIYCNEITSSNLIQHVVQSITPIEHEIKHVYNMKTTYITHNHGI